MRFNQIDGLCASRHSTKTFANLNCTFLVAILEKSLLFLYAPAVQPATLTAAEPEGASFFHFLHICAQLGEQHLLCNGIVGSLLSPLPPEGANVAQRSTTSTRSLHTHWNTSDYSPQRSDTDINNSSVQMTNEAIKSATAFKGKLFKSLLN